MFVGRKEKTTKSWVIADPLVFESPPAPTAPAIQCIDNARTSQDCGSSTAQSP
jgi:hypothetical protein